MVGLSQEIRKKSGPGRHRCGGQGKSEEEAPQGRYEAGGWLDQCMEMLCKGPTTSVSGHGLTTHRDLINHPYSPMTSAPLLP